MNNNYLIVIKHASKSNLIITIQLIISRIIGGIDNTMLNLFFIYLHLIFIFYLIILIIFESI